ncbi:tripartite tricarboxylate transporter TctB family protein [Denitromonas ohlonensis]|uniref:Tripartite tricarboxylate transporter TctB family protein n=2 Tax=Denitromonas TaxID=139331 RepID=A0A557SBI7_9RHOO|nr:tripartite tricarboxylate transporter TctB family protein [Denitromonas ohlonensis]TVO68383.1 tripartite tricarboxylate transporter TctB family protein [Denitromonas ohlonensis]TVO74661.1 tripartite tricarboxylate transporter TctB family protein [Denitromonas ohlonensis]TVT51058.1 MAG: tripartite tricarboxylate transporter TctB family protein [Denitromonas halophila]TVT67419.1 MAG: tripartite tricarboxylate transporter TctB family protein [Denitromonas halophila]
MSERIFGAFLLLLSVGGIFVGWDLKAPISYEPVGPRAFPLLVFSLLGVCALGLILTRREATEWAPSPVLLRVGAMFLTVLAYALLFDKLGFVISTALMSVPLARFFGGTWRQAMLAGTGLGVLLFLFFDRLLDVVLPVGYWLKPLLG